MSKCWDRALSVAVADLTGGIVADWATDGVPNSLILQMPYADAW
jgi:hypothetical protein